jgi:hypothetical protein
LLIPEYTVEKYQSTYKRFIVPVSIENLEIAKSSYLNTGSKREDRRLKEFGRVLGKGRRYIAATA